MFSERVNYRNCSSVAFMHGLKPEDSPNPRMAPLPLDTSEIQLNKGCVVKERHRPLLCDLVYDKDQPVVLRDGVTIYVDVFRPKDEEKHPAILSWTPYGKINPPNDYDIYFNRAEMAKDKSSGLDTFESPDPDYWVNRGYIVIVADSRGSTNSEGGMRFFGNEEAYDIYDVIEWTAEQSWCSGNVGMAGNSWLAICQNFAAALQPPHLKAIAPWESTSDMYYDSVCRGGIPAAEFSRGIVNMLRLGEEGIEDVFTMLEEHPDYDDYWLTEKRPDFDKITIPAYYVGSYSSNVHPGGTIRAFNLAKTEEKWLRIHNTQEWPDQYTPKYRDELCRFFDHYLKGEDNGWEKTPRVRISILEETGPDTVDLEVDGFPIQKTNYRELYLAQDLSLSDAPVPEEGQVSYDTKTDSTGNITFRYTFSEDTELCGFFKARLFMSTDKGNDMDVFVYVNKEDSSGVPYKRKVLGVDYEGASGRLRASRREIADDSLIYDVKYHFDHDAMLKENEIVELEIVTWPLSMRWRKGETLCFTVSAGDMQRLEFPAPPCKTRNQGNHTIYTGEQHPSCLIVPEFKR